MDGAASIPRLSAYFAFGVQWDPNRSQPGAAVGRTDAASDARAGRIVDVTAQTVNSNARRNEPAQAATQRKSNIFLDAPPATTYAPPARAGQAVRIFQTSQPLGQNLDTWG